MNNLHAANKIFNIVTEMEMAHQLTGVNRHQYLARRAAKEQGQTRKTLYRLVALGADLPRWVEVFLKEFGV